MVPVHHFVFCFLTRIMVAVDYPNSSCSVVGPVEGALDGASHAGGTDIFAMKLDSAGAHQWTYETGSPGEDNAEAILGGDFSAKLRTSSLNNASC